MDQPISLLASIVENEIRDNDDARSRMHTVVDAILEECRTMSIEPTLGNMLKNEECLTEALSRREITGEDLTAMWCRAEDVAYASSSTTSSSGESETSGGFRARCNGVARQIGHPRASSSRA